MYKIELVSTFEDNKCEFCRRASEDSLKGIYTVTLYPLNQISIDVDNPLSVTILETPVRSNSKNHSNSRNNKNYTNNSSKNYTNTFNGDFDNSIANCEPIIKTLCYICCDSMTGTKILSDETVIFGNRPFYQRNRVFQVKKSKKIA